MPGTVIEEDLVAKRKMVINEALDAYLTPQRDGEPEIYSAIRHTLLAGGFRWRPVMVLTVADMFGADERKFLPFACGVELIHAAAMILDDLPCMDNAERRHGKAACHRVFGEAVTILASHQLLVLSLKLFHETLSLADPDAVRFPRNRFNSEYEHLMSNMIAGQTKDVLATGKDLIEQEVLFTYVRKSGALYEFSTRLPALLAGATPDEIESVSMFGRFLGIAYQILDDIYDIEGGPEEVGKDIGKDVGKPTFPSLFGCIGAKARMHHFKNHALEQLLPMGEGAASLRRLAERIVPSKALL